jgi:hypothetical protein
MMKSFAALIASTNLLSLVTEAVEHPLLTSTSDFQETWKEKTQRDDLLSELKDLEYTKHFDSSRRPVIGVLTEPLRGDLYKVDDRLKLQQMHRGEDTIPGYVPKAHVQFLEQAGVRVVPIDYRLSRDELVTMFDSINGIYLPGDSQLAVTDETYKGAFVIAMAYAENAAFEVKEHFPVFLMGNSLSTWIRSKQSRKGTLKEMKEH